MGKEFLKTITRTYYSKRAGGYVTKVYEYTYKKENDKLINVYKRSKPDVIVYKSGKLNKENFNKMLATFTDEAERQDFKNIVKFKQQNKEKLSETYFRATKEKDEIKRMFVNLGYSYNEAAAEIGVDEAQILNKENWDGNVFESVTVDKTGKKEQIFYRLVWNYNKNVFHKMKESEVQEYLKQKKAR